MCEYKASRGWLIYLTLRMIPLTFGLIRPSKTEYPFTQHVVQIDTDKRLNRDFCVGVWAF